MEVRLTADQEAFVRDALESGRLESPEEAAQEAFALWEERERRRAELRASLDAAEAAIDAGLGEPAVTRETVQELAARVKERGRARLASQRG